VVALRALSAGAASAQIRAPSLAWSPEPNGRYKLTVTTVKDYGGSNCAESDEDRTGKTDELNLLFNQSRDTMQGHDEHAAPHQAERAFKGRWPVVASSGHNCTQGRSPARNADLCTDR
jgi:hypothetical protein